MLLVSAPALAQRLPLSDTYYACLVGKAAVEINYGVEENKAFATALAACTAEGAETEKEPGGDMGIASHRTEQAAKTAVSKLAN